ncbi:unnamed protein product [Pelagomonas calceolata]|uniref:Fe2OG dioxygenase domain-containing protein n=1 Tax=Pelagomonas calceolata TaxID=35677 RepID=A0A8J2SG34_9STRA|nr:unnamed protein product [Pelagomonas calceolata]
MNVYLKTLAGDVFAVGMTDPEAIAAAEASGVRVCPPCLLAEGGVGEDTTIDQLKGYVAAMSIYPAGDQRMIFAGKRLEDTRTLRHYGIRAESTVHLITRTGSSATLRREGGDPEPGRTPLPSVLDVSSDARLHATCHAALIWTALAPPGEGEATCLHAAPPVFLLPVLTPEASEAIITHARPGLVERRGHATAAQLGLAAFTAKLVKHVLGPAVHNLYPGVRVDADASHAFILWHAATNPDRAGASLWRHRSDTGEPTSEHVDDSTVTVNFTLGGDFAGSDLSFACGDRLVVPQRPGLAVVHAGDLAHAVEPITAGERFNLVFWLRERR